MCGIAGIIDLRDSSFDETTLVKMNDAIVSRGPDQEGYFFAGHNNQTTLSDSPAFSHNFKFKVALAHRRLSIIDLSDGFQPMISDGESAIVFNGEIYNYLEIRNDLKDYGVFFETNSDTEVILKAYRRWGFDCLKKLNGMFAFAIYDMRKNILFAARDRLGKKPFYFKKDDNSFIFSSELPSLLRAVKLGDSDVNTSCIASFLQFQYVHSPQSIYKNIYKLKPAHFISLDLGSGQMQESSYWKLSAQTDYSMSFEEASEEAGNILENATSIRLRSDVPVAAFLSGGVDSSMICSLMRKISDKSFTAFTIGYENVDFDESAHAAETAKHLGLDFHKEIIDIDFFDDIDGILTRFGEPFGDSSCLPTYAVSKIASSDYKVVLTGDGGDEIFAGYNTYESIRQNVSCASSNGCFSGFIGKLKRMILNTPDSDAFAYRRHHRQVMTLFKDEELQNLLLPDIWDNRREPNERYLEKPENWLVDCQHSDLKTYLVDDILTKVDRMSMMNSLELRSPLLDYRLVELAFRLPMEYKFCKTQSGVWEKKRILKNIASKYLSRETLDRPKQGFGFPVGNFLDKNAFLFKKLLTDFRSSTEKFFYLKPIEDMLKKHGDMNTAVRLWYIYCFIVWHHRYIASNHG
jgi:asparagine synthase (glutamine-hydrolysing)